MDLIWPVTGIGFLLGLAVFAVSFFLGRRQDKNRD